MTVSDLTVSLPVSSFLKGSVASVTLLAHRLSMISLPLQWVVACDAPLTLSKVSVIDDGHPSVTVDLSVSFKDDFQWVTMIGSNTCTLYPRFVSHLPQYIHSVEDILAMLHLFESVKMCVGNPDTCLVEAWKKNCTSLHNGSGMLKITLSDCFHYSVLKNTWILMCLADGVFDTRSVNLFFSMSPEQFVVHFVLRTA